MDREPDLQFTVIGEPKGAGSVTAHVVRRRDGSIVTRSDGDPMVVKHDSSGRKGEQWRDAVATEALAASGGEMFEGPLVIEMTFYRQRPAGHFRTGRNAHLLKDGAPSRPITRPDVLKLARAVEDALTSVVYRDDAQIVEERLSKRFAAPERVEVRLWRYTGEAEGVVPDSQASLLAA